MKSAVVSRVTFTTALSELAAAKIMLDSMVQPSSIGWIRIKHRGGSRNRRSRDSTGAQHVPSIASTVAR